MVYAWIYNASEASRKILITVSPKPMIREEKNAQESVVKYVQKLVYFENIWQNKGQNLQLTTAHSMY